MPLKKIECPICNSTNTKLDIEEEFNGEEETIFVTIKCFDCKEYSSFPDDKDWRDYD